MSFFLRSLFQHDHASIAFIDEAGELRFAELMQHAANLSAHLRMQGLAAGMRLPSIGLNARNSLLLQLACADIGAIWCPLNSHHPLAQLERLCEQLGATCYCAEQSILPTLSRLNLNASASQHKLSPWPHAQHVSMVFTSGSSGMPKAVVHSFANHYFSALGASQLLPLSATSRWLMSLPLFHIGGQAIMWRCLIAGCAMLASSQPLSVRLLSKQSITHLSLVPTQLYRLLQDPQFNAQHLALRYLLVGGAACNEGLLQQAQARGFRVFSSYGSSEMCSQVATREHGVHDAYQVLAHRQIEVRGDMLWLKGDTLFAGYWREGKLTLPLDAQGWFNSGDKAQLDAQGLRILGRADNLFICGGENIQPEEIEQALLQHKDIEQAVVLSMDDNEYGQRPVALIHARERINTHALVQLLRAHLAPIKLPVAYYQLPAQASLKPSRSQLKQALSENTLRPFEFEATS